MSDIRILDLAKELELDVAEVQQAASSCGVAASGPTAKLDDGDRKKITAYLKTRKEASVNKPDGKKTLTLNKPMVAGQPRAGGNVEGRGHTVQVEVRRRRRPGMPGATEGAPASEPKARESMTPAERAEMAVEQQRQAARTAEAEPAPAPVAPEAQPARPVEAARSAEPEQRPAPRPTTQRPASRPTTQRPAPRPARPDDRRPREGRPQNTGPRTTIRRTLTPAQIAASRAPRSTLKEIEARIKDERNQGRSDGPRGARPQQRPAGGIGPRRTPSVAVAPDAMAPGGDAAKRRGPGGPPAARGKRRLNPGEKAAMREYAEKRHIVLTEEEEERMARLARGDRKRGRRNMIDKDHEFFVKREVEITDPIVVGELASRMAVKSGEVVKQLFDMGMPVTTNETIDADTAMLIVEEFGHTPKLINRGAVEDVLFKDKEEDDEHMKPRPPIVVVMGHVDHGKTSILDAIRKAAIAEGEAGGITQHIGAYMAKLSDGKRVVFIDTPGHEAFTSLRARGASMTDVAVLVVAADDGVKPQTVEALNHARAAGVPIIVAINKMDMEGANPDNVKRQLAELNLISEDWGGDTIFVEVSAKTGQGLDDLVEMLALQSEVLELKANPDRPGRGIIIEAKLDRGRGPVATVLVKGGTFKTGDVVVAGTVMGRIRALVDENGVQHRTAGPSVPAEVLGLESVPDAGQEMYVVETERQARDIIRFRMDKLREAGVAADAANRATMEDLFAGVAADRPKEIKVLIKGDVSGSIDALADSLSKLATDEVSVRVVHKGIGGITESDVMLASASNAIVIGFNVRPEVKAKKLAEADGVDVRFYKIIYEAIDDMRAAMEGTLAPNKVEKVIGSADVREIFTVPKQGVIAGCFVTDGHVERNAGVRVLRDGVLVYDGLLSSLRRFKDDVKEVRSGYECGIGVEKFNDIKVGDTFEFYIIEEVAAKL
jgi:translation initiation factor IF-2